ncbi:hypothetical protein [Pseudovibrio sp. SPO723]|uniref:hypothetical protein n=1 Tax=Nesiotobacter zosterae TaxID=392721 RepID=UPI0029C1E778|nr:hypothetical protein [Pseudovibrio sp. SPO723]MDX5592940.1 hypothetical protein [Pseudovibrio sp. SPO723]
MSAAGQNTAVVSLGISCQSARQIRTHVELISSLIGEPVQHVSHFFDGLITPPEGLAKLLDDGFPLFTREQIEEGAGHPTWHPYGIRFFHHFRGEDGIADVNRYFENETSRFSYLKNRFLELRNAQHLLFVLSNSQNNLDEVAEETELGPFHFEQRHLEELKASLRAFFAKDCDLLVVSHEEKVVDVEYDHLHILEPDSSEWTGDKRQWAEVFRKHLTIHETLNFV